MSFSLTCGFLKFISLCFTCFLFLFLLTDKNKGKIKYLCILAQTDKTAMIDGVA